MTGRNGTLPRLGRDAAQRILSYDRAVFARFERRIRRLPKGEAFVDRGTGHGSYFETLVHILNVRDAWFNFVVLANGAGETAFFDRPARHPKDWRGFSEYAPTVWAGHERLAAEVTDARLRGRVTAFWMQGRYTLGDAILQVSYEQAHHLGEIIGAFWVVDRAPPAMTWIDVTRDDPSARPGHRRAARA